MDSKLKNIIIEVLLEYDPVMIGIFGSCSRNEQTKESDIDILVKFRTPVTHLQLVHAEKLISDKTGLNTDLITEGSIRNTIIKDNIFKDLQVIYQ